MRLAFGLGKVLEPASTRAGNRRRASTDHLAAAVEPHLICVALDVRNHIKFIQGKILRDELARFDTVQSGRNVVEKEGRENLADPSTECDGQEDFNRQHASAPNFDSSIQA